MELADQYIYKVYKKRSFTTAAKELFISQPSLSAMVAKREKELGFKIFDRSISPLGLTAKGRIYVEMLLEIRDCEKHMQNRLKHFSEKSAKEFSIGCYISIGYSLLPSVLWEMQRRNPQLFIQFNTGSEGRPDLALFDALDENRIELMINYRYDENRYDATRLYDEKAIVAVRRNQVEVEALLPYAIDRREIIHGTYPKELEVEDLSLFQGLTFIYSKQLQDVLGDQYTLAQLSCARAFNLKLFNNLMKTGFGATIISDLQLRDDFFDSNDFLYFIPKAHVPYRTLYAIHKKGSKLSDYSKEFLSILTDVLSPSQA